MIDQQQGKIPYLQFQSYLQFPELIHGVFTRKGGISQSPYAELNTSTPPGGAQGDGIEHVVHNRRLITTALGIDSLPCVTLWQVHSSTIVTFKHHQPWRTDWAAQSYYAQSWTPETIRKGDALLTQERRIAFALSFADCVPIVFYDPHKQVMAIAHGGWRGTAQGIVLATIEAMQEQFACRPEEIYAGIGPAIGACCYEVSATIQEIFSGRLSFDEISTHQKYRKHVHESAVFSIVEQENGNSLRLDLQETNRNQLLMAGLLPEQIEIMRICTSCHSERFFSHRREQGKTGRFAVLMALQGQ